MKKRSGFIPIIVGIAFALVSQTSFGAAVSLKQDSFNPGQPHATYLTVSAPCSLTIRAASSLGAGIVLEDRMTGVVARDGNPGGSDGRIDYTLDAGEYRITVLRGESDTGTIRLTAEPLKEANSPGDQALLLNSADGALMATTLRDGEQKSFWVRHNAEDSPLILEAAGRSLRSVQLWKDGQLLTADKPFLRTIAPDPGKSLRYAEFNFAESSRNLPTGDYLVVFVGGEMLPWELKGSEQPLYIRKGMKSLGSAWVGDIQIGPFGFEHFTADGYFRAEAERPEDSDAGLSSGSFPGYGQGSRWNSVEDEGSTDKETPLVSISSSGSDHSWIRVSGRPGLNVELRLIPNSYQVYLDRGNQYLVTGIASSSLRDSLDLTGLCISDNSVVQDRSVELSSEKPIIRMTGMREMQGMFIRVTEAGVYRVIEDDEAGGSAEYGFLRLSQGTESLADEDNSWTLSEDVYFLSVGMKEKKPGILRFALVKSGSLSLAQIKAKGLFKQPPLPREGLTFQNVSGGYYEDTAAVLGFQNEGDGGIFAYQLPLTGSEPVLLFLSPGEEASIPVRGKMNARSSRNLSSVSVSISGQSLLKVKNTGKSSDFIILEPEMTLPKKTPPSPKALDKTLQRLNAHAPVYRDYTKNEIVQYLVSVEKPGYYLLETTGRLQTSITVRTYVRPSLFAGSAGGSGRNAQVVAYLAKGDYLAEVKTGAQSAGRGGLRLSPVQRREGGTVVEGEVVRTELAAGEGYTFTLKVENPGYHRIEAASLGTLHSVRVEDEEGWLISAGNNPRLEFKTPGIYTIHSLPSAAPHRRRFQVVREPDPVVSADPEKGIIELPLMSSFEAVWNERSPRLPHRYAVRIPSDADVSFSLSKEMYYRILKDGSVVSEGDGGVKPLSLAEGDYRIEVSTREKDNGRPYRIGLTTVWLLPGVPQNFQSQKASFKVSVPEDGIYDIESLSPSDLIAELYDAQGRRVASNDDRKLDWDFSISTHLSKGLYTLTVSSIFNGSKSAQIQITGRTKRDIGMVTLPHSSVYTVKRETLSFSFTPQTTGVYRFSAEHPAVEQVLIERGSAVLASGVSGVFIPLVKGRNYQATLVSSSLKEAEIPVSLIHLTATSWNLSKDPLSGVSGPFRVEGAGNFSYSFASAGTVLFASADEKQMKEAKLYPRSFTEGSGWVLLTDRKGRLQDGTIRSSVANAENDGFIAVPDENPVGFVFSGAPDSVSVLRAESRQGLSGMRLSQSISPPAPAALSSAIRPGETVSAVYGGKAMTGCLWNALTDSKGESVRVSLERYPVAATHQMKDETTLSIPSRSAVRIEVPSDVREVSLLLARGIIFLNQGTDQSEVLWADSGNTAARMRLSWPFTLAVNTTDKDLLVRIAKGSYPAVSSVSAGQSWREVISGKTELSLETGGAWLIFGEGLASPPLLLGDDGSVRTGAAKADDLFLLDAVPGTLTLEGKGLVQLAAAKGDDYYGHLILPEDSSSLPLISGRGPGWDAGLPSLSSGKNKGAGWFVLAVEEPALVTVQSEGGGYLALFGGKPVHSFKDRGSSISAYMDAGRYPVYWNPVRKDSELSLDIRIPESFTDNSRERFIDAGEEHIYSFTVSERAAVGVGIKAERDECDMRLFDTSFREIAKGPFVYQTLEKGSYLVVIGGAEGPVQYIPLLYGNTGSLSGIPEGIKKGYKEDADE